MLSLLSFLFVKEFISFCFVQKILQNIFMKNAQRFPFLEIRKRRVQVICTQIF